MDAVEKENQEPAMMVDSAVSGATKRISSAARKSEPAAEKKSTKTLEADIGGGDDDDGDEDDLDDGDDTVPPPATTASSATSKEVDDPQSLTVMQLKSWLTRLNVTFPQQTKPKTFYLQLLYEHEPQLQGRAVPALPSTRKSQGKRRR